MQRSKLIKKLERKLGKKLIKICAGVVILGSIALSCYIGFKIGSKKGFEEGAKKQLNIDIEKLSAWGDVFYWNSNNPHFTPEERREFQKFSDDLYYSNTILKDSFDQLKMVRILRYRAYLNEISNKKFHLINSKPFWPNQDSSFYSKTSKK